MELWIKVIYSPHRRLIIGDKKFFSRKGHRYRRSIIRKFFPVGNHIGRDYRASGDCICHTCKQPYKVHLMDGRLSHDGQPFLHILCNGDRVKL